MSHRIKPFIFLAVCLILVGVMWNWAMGETSADTIALPVASDPQEEQAEEESDQEA